MIGFIYLVEYIGNNELIKGKKYIGSRKCYGNWKSYLGSPVSCCDVVTIWRNELERNPDSFKRTIIKEIYDADVDLYHEEYLMMKEYNVSIIKESEWINRSYPIIGGMNTPLRSNEEKEIMASKRRSTLLSKYDVDHYSKTPDMRELARVAMQTPEVRDRRGKSIKATYDNLPEDVKVQRAKDRAYRYKQWYHDPANKEIVEQYKERKRQAQIKTFVSVEDENGARITFPICESFETIGIKSGVVWKRKRGVTASKMKNKDGKLYKFIDK